MSVLPVITICLSVLGLVLGSSLLLILIMAPLICRISAILLPPFPVTKHSITFHFTFTIIICGLHCLINSPMTLPMSSLGTLIW